MLIAPLDVLISYYRHTQEMLLLQTGWGKPPVYEGFLEEVVQKLTLEEAPKLTREHHPGQKKNLNEGAEAGKRDQGTLSRMPH